MCEYTQYTIFDIKKKETHPKLFQICSFGIFSKELKNEFETAMANKPSVFEPLKFDCIFVTFREKDYMHQMIRKGNIFFP